MIRNNISLAELGKIAEYMHRIADRVASGKLVAVSVVSCDHQGYISDACMIDGNLGSPEMIDAMVDCVKTRLFELYADQQEERCYVFPPPSLRT
jgi:hypothetical protein